MYATSADWKVNNGTWSTQGDRMNSALGLQK